MKASKLMKGHNLVRGGLIVLLLVYIVGVVPKYNHLIMNLLQDDVVKVLLFLVAVMLGYHDPVIAVLLVLAVLFTYFSSHYMGSIPSEIVSNVRRGAQEVVDIPEDIAHEMEKKNNSTENMSNKDLPSVSQAYQEQMQNEQKYDDCSTVPAPMTGCDPIVGYNASYDCVCSQDCEGDCEHKDKSCLCKGVETWKDEMNAQGMNYPMGFGGSQEGATF